MISTRHRTLLAVVVLGGSALAVDKLVIGYSGPATAGAATAPDTHRVGEQTDNLSTTKPSTDAVPKRQSHADTGILGKLARLDSSELTMAPNPFSAQSWERPRQEPVGEPSPPQRARPATLSVQDLRVSSTVLPSPQSGQPAFAIINGRRVTPGQSVGGVRVESITATGVTVTRDGLRAEVRIPRPDDAESPESAPETSGNRE